MSCWPIFPAITGSFALMAKDTGRVLAFNGRLLVGLVLLFACIWRLAVSTDYAGGTFFQVTMITDDRFEGFARVAGGLDKDRYAELRESLLQHLDVALHGILSDAGRLVLQHELGETMHTNPWRLMIGRNSAPLGRYH